MRLSEIIESFDSHHTPTLEINTNSRYSLSTVIGNKKIVFLASKGSCITNPNVSAWEIVFSEINNGVEQFHKTNTGYEMQVFSFIIDCVKDLITDKDPDIIEFSASKKDGNREKLYSKLATKIKISGYKFSGTHQGSQDTYFIFSKVKN